MKIEYQYPLMIFRKDNQYGTTYSVGLSKKNQDGSYTNGYMPIQFKKGIELENQTKIFMKNAFLTFYIGTKEKKTIPYIMCTEYEIAKFDKVKSNSEIIKEAYETPSENINEEFMITDEDLPF